MQSLPERPSTIYLPQYRPKLAISGHIKNGVWVPLRDQHNNVIIENGKPKLRPMQLDHYVVTKLEKDEQTNNFVVDEVVMAKLPKDQDGKVRKIPIFVHSDDFKDFFPMQLVGRVGRIVSCVGDGRTAVRTPVKAGLKVGKPEARDCPCEWLDKDRKPSDPRCKPQGALRCKLALPEAITVGSVYDFYTTSEMGLPEMLGGFTEILNIIGTLVWVPMWLELRSRTVQPEGYQKTVWTSFVHIRGNNIKSIQAEALAVTQAAQEIRRLTGRSTLELLPPPLPIDEEGVSDEFAGDDGVVEATEATRSGSSPAALPAGSGSQSESSPADEKKAKNETPATPQTKRTFSELLGKLSLLVYGGPAEGKTERERRKAELWERTNFEVGYRFTTMCECHYEDLIEILAGHIKLEEGLAALERLMFEEAELGDATKRAERRNAVWKRVTAGLEIEYGKISPAALDELNEHISERLAIAHDEEGDGGDGDDSSDEPQGESEGQQT